MTIQEAIQKAADGGYQVSLKRLPCFCHNDPMCIDAPKPYDEYKTLLDPLFWQALGKSMGWAGKCADCYKGEPHKWCLSGSHLDLEPEKYHKNYPWRVEWRLFIDHLAEGGTIESYFKNL